MKTNKYFSIALLLIFSFVLTGCSLFKKQDQATKTDTKQTNESQESDGELSGSFLDIFKMNKNTKCTYASTMEGANFSGDVYVSGNKVRSNGSFTADNKTYKNYMISDGTWLYTWSDLAPTGMKIKMETLEDTVKDKSKTNNQNDLSQLNQNVSYSCDSWNPDSSMFDVPTNINFVDYTEMMKNVMQSTPLNTNAACNACNMINDATTKAQCLAQLQCK